MEETRGGDQSIQQALELQGIKNLQPVPEEYVLWQWALGEARNPKWQRRNSYISSELQEKVKTVSPHIFEDQFSAEERQAIIKAFLEDEARLSVAKIQALKCEWYKGVIPIERIMNCYMVMWPLSEQLAPSGKLLEYAQTFQERIFPPDTEFDREKGNIQRLYESFDLSQMIGAPILLSQTGNQPFCAVDGITRLCVISKRIQEGSLTIPEFPVIIGVSADIFDWEKIPRLMQRAEGL